MNEDQRAAFSAEAIANYFLKDRLGRMTQLQVQKLVYLAHGMYLAVHGKPLIEEKIQAWRYGPVIPSLRSEFASFRASPIDRLAKDTKYIDGQVVITNPTIEDENPSEAPDVKHVLDQVNRIYGHMTGPQLSTLTHQKDTPWHQVYKLCNENDSFDAHIPNPVIKKHFEDLLNGSVNG